MSKVCLITFFSGDFPNYFRFFVASCQKNPGFDFVVFNDRIAGDRREGNVWLRKFSLGDFERRVAEKTGIRARVKRGYKLADFKPLYGQLFEEDLRGYDFWGYCDLDLIFGRISDFITPELLADFDVITTTEKWISGHFTLLRNNEFCRRLFERSPSHRQMLEDPETNWYLEESCKRWKGEFFTIDHLVANGMPVSMYDVVRNLERTGELKARFKSTIREHTLRDRVDYLYEDGKLTDLGTGEEFMYHHLITIKNFWHFYIPGWKEIPSRYRITGGGIQSVAERAGWRHAVWQVKRAGYYARGVARSALRRAGWR